MLCLPSPLSSSLHFHFTEGFSFEIFLNSSLCVPCSIILIQAHIPQWLLWPTPNWFFSFVQPLSSLAPNTSLRLDSVYVLSQISLSQFTSPHSPTWAMTICLTPQEWWFWYSHKAQLLRLQPPQAYVLDQPAPFTSLDRAHIGSGFPSCCSDSADPTQSGGMVAPHGADWDQMSQETGRGQWLNCLHPLPTHSMDYFKMC